MYFSKIWNVPEDFGHGVFQLKVPAELMFPRSLSICLFCYSRPGHNSDIKTNYKSAYVGALEPIMGTLAEPAGDGSSSSTVAISSGVSSKHLGC